MSDWCPENDGAYRAEMAAMYPVANRKRIAELIEEGSVMAQKLDAAEAKLAKAMEAGVGVAASLNAAISLLERGGKKAAPSDKMFNQMLLDYKASLARFRTTLTELEGET